MGNDENRVDDKNEIFIPLEPYVVVFLIPHTPRKAAPIRLPKYVIMSC